MAEHICVDNLYILKKEIHNGIELYTIDGLIMTNGEYNTWKKYLLCDGHLGTGTVNDPIVISNNCPFDDLLAFNWLDR